MRKTTSKGARRYQINFWGEDNVRAGGDSRRSRISKRAKPLADETPDPIETGSKAHSTTGSNRSVLARYFFNWGGVGAKNLKLNPSELIEPFHTVK